MTENSWWSTYIKPRWHNLEKGWVARKVQDVTNKGAPDVDACWSGFSCKVELKYSPTIPYRSETKLTFSRYSKDEPNRRTVLSREQLRNLEEWDNAGGNAFVLIGAGKRWYFLHATRFRADTGYNDGVTIDELVSLAINWGDDIKEVGRVPETIQGFIDG